MDQASPLSPTVLIDLSVGAAVLANMLSAMIEADPTLMSSVEACDEHDHHSSSPEQTGVRYVGRREPVAPG